MTVTIELPPAIERQLRLSVANLDEVAKEATLVEIYRRGQLSQNGLATALGVDRFTTEELLKRHKVVEDLISPAEYREEAETLRRLLGR